MGLHAVLWHSQIGGIMKRVLPVLVLFSSLPLFAADKANADALNRWVGGKWPLEGKMLDTDYSKAVRSPASAIAAGHPTTSF